MHAARHLNVLAGAAVIAVNQLANYLPLNGQTTGEVAANFSVLSPLARFAFSIWFVIYALIVAFCVYQYANHPAVEGLSGPFLASCAFNIAWIFLWHYGFIALSLIATVGLTSSVATAYLRMPPHPRGIAQYLSVNALFSIYLAWMSVTTVLHGSIILEEADILRWGGEAVDWLVLLVLLATVYSSHVSLLRSDPLFPLAFIWSLAALAVGSRDIPHVAYPALGAALALILVSLYVVARFRVESCPDIPAA
ncbi:MAG: TspO/MBR family protein [Bacillota bacterium]